MDAAIDLDYLRHASELREMWQARVLAATTTDPMGVIVLSVLAHNFDDAMSVLLRVVFPGFTSITAPFLCSAAKIARTGHVCADMVERNGKITKMAPLFHSTRDMEARFRKLADDLKLTDSERQELFAAVRRWVVCDYRLDPTMDPRDPDAKRLLH